MIMIYLFTYHHTVTNVVGKERLEKVVITKVDENKKTYKRN